MPALSIIIVSYRVRDLLAACLQSIEDNGFPAEWETICLDNHSGDGTVEALQPRFPKVRWIANQDNVGFAPAVNQAAALASGRLLLLLNPDGRLIKGALERLADFLDARPDAGAVGPGLQLSNGASYVSATPFPTVLTMLLYEMRLNRLLPHSGLFQPYRQALAAGRPFPVDAVEGSCLLTRRALWEQVGGFDPRYFFGVEELDYAWKLKAAGYGVWHHPEPAMVHHHSGSSGGERRGRLIRLSIALGFLHFMRSRRPRSYPLLRAALLPIMAAKGAAALLLNRPEHATVFGQALLALLGLRPPWITAADKERWHG